MTELTEIKAYVNEKDEVHINCPKCRKIKIIDVTPYMWLEEPLNIKVECSCGHLFNAFIERRKYYRKPTSLFGSCFLPNSTEAIPITIENLSRTGIGFTTENSIPVSLGDLLKVSFILDRKKREVINEEVIVRRIRNLYIGADFRTVKEWYPELGYFLRP